MDKVVVYLHGQGGSADEAAHFRHIFADCDVMGFDYASTTPWEAKDEFLAYFEALATRYKTVWIIANSLGAYFAMCALGERHVQKAFFISPVVDMEKLI